MILPSKGDYAGGWPLYESRRFIDRSTTNNPPDHWPDLQCPEWAGDDLAGKRILVFGEQALGDIIMLGRFMSALETLGAVTHISDPSLVRLFRGSLPGLTTQALPEADFWTLAGSLPYRLGVTLENLAPPMKIDALPR